MYKLSFAIMLFCLSGVMAQKKSPESDTLNFKKEVKQTILQFFDGFHKGDTATMKKTIDKNVVLQTIAKNKEGKIKVFQTDIAKMLHTIHNRPETQKWDERLLSFTIEADRAIAHAWTPYEFYVNDTFSHCGVNVFQLYNDGNTWKIIAIADTRHKTGCK